MRILLAALIGCSWLMAPAVSSAAPADDLTQEEQALMPGWLRADYSADASGDPKQRADVVARYRRIVQALAALPQASRDAIAARGAAAATRKDRNDIVARDTGVSNDVTTYRARVGNDDASLALTLPALRPVSEFSVSATLKGGLLAPAGSTGDQNSTLHTSPYGYASIANSYDNGAFRAFAMATEAVMDLRSGKGIFDPTGTGASSAASLKTLTDNNQPYSVTSAYVDWGALGKFGSGVKGAVFGGADAVITTALNHAAKTQNPTEPMIAAHAGTVWLVRQAENQFTGWGDIQLQGAGKDLRIFGAFEAAPAGKAGVEYARITADRKVALGVDASIQRTDAGLRPYATYADGVLSTTVAGDFRKSLNPFWPDVAGAGVKVAVRPTPAVQLGVQGSLSREQYSMAPNAELNYKGLGTVDIDLDRRAKLTFTARAPEAYPVGPVPAGIDPLKARVVESLTPDQFLQAISASPTMPGFVSRIGARDLDQIFAAIAALSSDLNKWNYDHSDVGWAGTNAELYANARTSILEGKKIPDLQCGPAATLIAALAVEMGRQAGVPIQAVATGVEVPDSNGGQGGHFVAALKTQPYGIVFVDWGKLTPTYTFDTHRAMEIFQALQGIPDVAHYIADSSGHFVGYLFSDDGKVIVENLTYHSELPSPPLSGVFGDAPDGASVTIERYKRALETR
jgi:hypothetical protein